jgi:tetratricopeptide (TPR) repeat protein
MLNFQIERLKQLPLRREETWQGGRVRLAWVMEEKDKPFRPWTPLWVSVGTKLVSQPHPMLPENNTYATALEALVNFACDETRAGYRPGKLEVNNAGLAEHLEGVLKEAGISVTFREKLPTFNRMVDDLLMHLMGRDPIPGPLSVKGVTVERMRTFAEAAAAFFEAEPWDILTDEDLIRIESPIAPDMGLRYVSVLGAAGQTFGLGFFSSPEQMQRMRESDHPSKFFATDSVWSLTFDPITDLPYGDADLWEDHHLPVADSDMYPFVAKFENRGKCRRPNGQALAFFEGLLRAITEANEGEIDSGRWTKTVETFDGAREYTLVIPSLLEDLSLEDDTARRKGMPDRRVMEKSMMDIQRLLAEHEFKDIDEANAFLQEHAMGKGISHKTADTPLEKTQDMVYEAFEATGRRRVLLARKALEISEDCADAYNLLAEEARTLEKTLEWYRKGITAGERALGERYFKEEAGHFWGLIETRSYMRARQGLADSLKDLGEIEEATDHYLDMLRLNPNDNQGVRYSLLACLLDLNQNDKAGKLLKQFNDDAMAVWTYGEALLAFRLDGESVTSEKLLKQAITANRHVSQYLLGLKPLPDVFPNGYSLGSEDEAIVCADEIGLAWKQTPGALDWLKSKTEKKN